MAYSQDFSVPNIKSCLIPPLLVAPYLVSLRPMYISWDSPEKQRFIMRSWLTQYRGWEVQKPGELLSQFESEGQQAAVEPVTTDVTSPRLSGRILFILERGPSAFCSMQAFH